MKIMYYVQATEIFEQELRAHAYIVFVCGYLYCT